MATEEPKSKRKRARKPRDRSYYENELNRKRAIYISTIIANNYNSQKEFCKRTGYSSSSLKKFLTEGPDYQRFGTVMKLVELLNLNPYDFMQSNHSFKNYVEHSKFFSSYLTLNQFGRAKVREYIKDLAACEENIHRKDPPSDGPTILEQSTYYEMITDPDIKLDNKTELSEDMNLKLMIGLIEDAILNDYYPDIVAELRIIEWTLAKRKLVETFELEETELEKMTRSQLIEYYQRRTREIYAVKDKMARRLKNLHNVELEKVDRLNNRILRLEEKYQQTLEKTRLANEESRMALTTEKEKLRKEYEEKLKQEKAKLIAKTETEKQQLAENYQKRLEQATATKKERIIQTQAETDAIIAQLKAELETERQQIRENAKRDREVIRAELKEKAKIKRNRKIQKLEEQLRKKDEEKKIAVQKAVEKERERAYYEHYPGLKKKKKQQEQKEEEQ